MTAADDNADSQMHARVFVYGSLMRGGYYHGLLSRARFEGVAQTLARWRLIDLGPYPALVADGRTAVHGELYRVDSATLQKLDTLEGHPHEYLRQPIVLQDGGSAEAYVFPTERAKGLPEVASGDWRPHLNRPMMP